MMNIREPLSLINRLLMFSFFCIFIASCSSTDKDNNQAQSSDERADTLNSAGTINDSSKAVSSEYLIIPGQSIGKLKLDSNAAYVYDMWGKPDAGDAAMGKAVATWHDDPDSPDRGISIYTAQATENPPALIKQIRVTNPKYQTEHGIGPGAAFDTIQQTFNLDKGKGYKHGADSISVYSDRIGISFEIDSDQKCIGVLVYPKGTLMPDTYLKFLP